MIPIPEHLLFEAPSAFRVRPSKRSLWAGAPEVNSTMKFVNTCPLIAILGSYLMSYGFSFVPTLLLARWLVGSPRCF